MFCWETVGPRIPVVSLDTHLAVTDWVHTLRAVSLPDGRMTVMARGTWQWGWGINMASKFPKIQIWSGIKRDVPEHLCHEGVGGRSGDIDIVPNAAHHWRSVRLGSGIFGGQVNPFFTVLGAPLPSVNTVSMSGCTWSLTVFGLVVHVKCHSHECLDWRAQHCNKAINVLYFTW